MLSASKWTLWKLELLHLLSHDEKYITVIHYWFWLSARSLLWVISTGCNLNTCTVIYSKLQDSASTHTLRLWNRRLHTQLPDLVYSAGFFGLWTLQSPDPSSHWLIRSVWPCRCRNVFTRQTSTALTLMNWNSNWFSSGAVLTRTLWAWLLISVAKDCEHLLMWSLPFEAHHVNLLTVSIIFVLCEWCAQIPSIL